jgi:hypothetical protein
MPLKTPHPHHVPEPIRSHSERLAIEALERAQKRELEVAEQSSDLNPADVRIRAWEKVHALRLPSSPSHPVLRVIAIRTGLTLAQVHEEQRARNAQRSPRDKREEPSGAG